MQDTPSTGAQELPEELTLWVEKWEDYRTVAQQLSTRGVIRSDTPFAVLIGCSAHSLIPHKDIKHIQPTIKEIVRSQNIQRYFASNPQRVVILLFQHVGWG